MGGLLPGGPEAAAPACTARAGGFREIGQVDPAGFVDGPDGELRIPRHADLALNTTSSSPPSCSAIGLPIGTAPRGIAQTSGFCPRHMMSASASIAAA